MTLQLWRTKKPLPWSHIRSSSGTAGTFLKSESTLADYYRTNAEKGESHYDFCVREGWKKYIDSMIAVDFLILNRDRHGANIEVLRNARAHTLRIAPLFHSLCSK